MVAVDASANGSLSRAFGTSLPPNPRPQAADLDLEAGSLQGAVADPVPPGQQLLVGVPQPLADPGGLAAPGLERLEGAPQVGPADLPAVRRQMAGRPNSDPSRRWHGCPPRASPRLRPVPGSCEWRTPRPLGHRGPQPGLAAALPPAGLVEIDRGLLTNEGARLLHRPRQGRRHRLFQAADGAHRQSNPEGRPTAARCCAGSSDRCRPAGRPRPARWARRWAATRLPGQSASVRPSQWRQRRACN